MLCPPREVVIWGVLRKVLLLVIVSDRSSLILPALSQQYSPEVLSTLRGVHRRFLHPEGVHAHCIFESVLPCSASPDAHAQGEIDRRHAIPEM